ncbi:hypothetical protein [Fulvivirga ligni]|uniref:hypothetical protein n=1 Tax=Fulvivirga ligni TaxID=2904246 RepID=UPI001F19345A|nr:hypothetical protein [Fulvivirga ligni]UII20922.1 hypothetical protein LVD16_24060 [Fulvivirga ligni]
MEKFSNSRTEYWNQIIEELSNRKDIKSQRLRFQYIELGQLLTHAFSITQFEGKTSSLKLAIWNAEFDNKRFDKGIYNLDRLAVTNHDIALNPVELNKLEGLLKLDLELTNWGGITLDGLFCQFELGDKKLEWNSNQEINNNLISLIEFLRSKASLQHQLATTGWKTEPGS